MTTFAQRPVCDRAGWLRAAPWAGATVLLLLLGRNGPIGGFLEQTFGVVIAFRWTGAVLAAGVMAFPLMVRAIRLSLEAVDPKLPEAAATLGAPPWRVFATVTLPLILPGILAGAVLAAVHHAEVIAHRVGEPYGSLVLAVAVTIIEVALITTIMLGDKPAPQLARDTDFRHCPAAVSHSDLLGDEPLGLLAQPCQLSFVDAGHRHLGR